MLIFHDKNIRNVILQRLQLDLHDCDLIRLFGDDLIFLLSESLDEEALLLQGLVALMSHGEAVLAG